MRSVRTETAHPIYQNRVCRLSISMSWSKSAEKCIVLDSGAFIHGSNVFFDSVLAKQEVQLFTVPDVLKETRDRAARERLTKLVDANHNGMRKALVVRDPTAESLLLVMNEARKSGDYASLSMADMRVIALAYDVRNEHHLSNPKNLFYGADVTRLAAHDDGEESQSRATASSGSVAVLVPGKHLLDWRKLSKRIEGCFDPNTYTPHPVTERVNEAKMMKERHRNEAPHERVSSIEPMITSGWRPAPDNQAGTDNPSDGQWIGPDEVDEIASQMDDLNPLSASHAVPSRDLGEAQLSVMTTDFAMQNVTLRLGIGITGPNGRTTISHTRTHALLCCGCNYILTGSEMTRSTRQFCPQCGSYGTYLKCITEPVRSRSQKAKSLDAGSGRESPHYRIRLSPAVCSGGSLHPSTRGTTYSIPKPKGGRTGVHTDLILRADEYEEKMHKHQNRRRCDDAKGSASLDPAEPYRAGAKFRLEPSLRVAGSRRENPNESRKHKSRSTLSAARGRR